ncbi:cell division protein ZapA [Marinovum sp.]|uniref:cell division protein ZapA n=1 Tax=Marinovum sp. TaxID=2024839 RepID=UPI002B278662|nr:cell division protein ZapA [Marinovum sp.]
MPEVTITIGGRSFDVACQPGEEHFLHAAAGMLDAEARVLSDQIGRLPESRMLLMAGLMLADKTAGLEDKVRELEDRVTELGAEAEGLRNVPAPEPERIEVPVVPGAVVDTLAELAARAEAAADQVEAKARSD